MESSKLHNTAELYSVAAELHVSLDFKRLQFIEQNRTNLHQHRGKKSCQKCSALQKQEECGQAILHILMLDRSTSEMKPMDHHHPLMCDIT